MKSDNLFLIAAQNPTCVFKVKTQSGNVQSVTKVTTRQIHNNKTYPYPMLWCHDHALQC
jgi:hypothetical protein